jgi:hypothetical protein
MSFDFAIACRGCAAPLRLLDSPQSFFQGGEEPIQRCFACYPNLYCGNQGCQDLSAHQCVPSFSGYRGRNVVKIISQLFPQIVSEVEKRQKKSQMLLLSGEEILKLGPGELGELFSLYGVSYKEEYIAPVVSSIQYFLSPENNESVTKALESLKSRCAEVEKVEQKEDLKAMISRVELISEAFNLAQNKKDELIALLSLLQGEEPDDVTSINQTFGLLFYLLNQVHLSDDDLNLFDRVNLIFEDSTTLSWMEADVSSAMGTVRKLFLEHLSLVNQQKEVESKRSIVQREMFQLIKERATEEHRSKSVELSNLSSGLYSLTLLESELNQYRAFSSKNADEYNYTLNLSPDVLDEVPETLRDLVELGGNYTYQDRAQAIKKKREVLSEVNKERVLRVKGLGRTCEIARSSNSLARRLNNLETPENKAREALEEALVPQIKEKEGEDYYPLLTEEIRKLKDTVPAKEWSAFLIRFRQVGSKIDEAFTKYQYNAVLRDAEIRILNLQDAWDERFPNCPLYEKEPQNLNFGWSNLRKSSMNHLKTYLDHHRVGCKKAALMLFSNTILRTTENLPDRAVKVWKELLVQVTDWIRSFNEQIVQNVHDYCISVEEKRAAVETAYERNKAKAFANARMNTFSGTSLPGTYSLTVMGDLLGTTHLHLLLTKVEKTPVPSPSFTPELATLPPEDDVFVFQGRDEAMSNLSEAPSAQELVGLEAMPRNTQRDLESGYQTATPLVRAAFPLRPDRFAESVATLFFKRTRVLTFNALEERTETRRQNEFYLYGNGEIRLIRRDKWDPDKKVMVFHNSLLKLQRVRRDPLHDRVRKAVMIDGQTRYFQIMQKRKLTSSPLALYHLGAENSNEHRKAKKEREALDLRWREKYKEGRIVARSDLKKLMEVSGIAYVPPKEPPKYQATLPDAPFEPSVSDEKVRFFVGDESDSD